MSGSGLGNDGLRVTLESVVRPDGEGPDGEGDRAWDAQAARRLAQIGWSMCLLVWSGAGVLEAQARLQGRASEAWTAGLALTLRWPRPVVL